MWTPGDTLVIDWGSVGGPHLFCAVLGWSRFRFVRFAADEKANTTLGPLAECFEVLGGAPKTVLGDRMGCLKVRVVANIVVPAPDYVRFATHYPGSTDRCSYVCRPLRRPRFSCCLALVRAGGRGASAPRSVADYLGTSQGSASLPWATPRAVTGSPGPDQRSSPHETGSVRAGVLPDCPV